MKEEKVTIADIAKQLNISPITVSRALSGQSGVGDKLRKKIIEKAKELGYKRIKYNEKINILVLIRHSYTEYNSNLNYLVQGIEKNVKEYGASFTVEFIEEEKYNKLELPYNLSKDISKNNKFNGVILIGGFEHNYAQFIKEKIDKMVIFNGYSYELECSYIYFNKRRIGYKAGKYLINKGHKKIGYIGDGNLLRNQEMFLGFSRVMENQEIQMCKDYIIADKMNMQEKVKQLINDKNLPTAFICSRDFRALRLIRLLYENNISVPNDISIIGSGNTRISSISIPSLTTFDMNIEYACKITVKHLINIIKQPNMPSEDIYVNAIFIERESVKDINNEKQ